MVLRSILSLVLISASALCAAAQDGAPRRVAKKAVKMTRETGQAYAPAGTDAAPFPAGYWESTYYGNPSYGYTYNIVLEVSDPDAAINAIEKLAHKHGAMMRGQPQDFGNKQRYLNIEIPAQDAAGFAMNIAAVGLLRQFTSNPTIPPRTLADMDKKIDQLETEISKNRETLKEMPIANYFLTTNLKRLTSGRDSYQKNAKKANITVTLSQPQ